MTEKHIILEDIDPVLFYGTANSNMQVLKSLFPQLRIVARDNVIRVLGEEKIMDSFAQKVEKLTQHALLFNSLETRDIVEIVAGKEKHGDLPDDVLVYSMNGKPIRPRTDGQRLLASSFLKNDLTFAVGPAGTGKTYLSIALAVKALKEKKAKRLILSRPAVEAGEKLGFLPGDMKEKVDPYLQPLYDALEDMIPNNKLQEMTEHRTLQIAPLAYMRGRTLSDAVIILDEAQNATRRQMKMFLTRMGSGSKVIVSGDTSQTDLPSSQRSGLAEALSLLKDIDGIAIVKLSKNDILRHKLVNKIVEAYDNNEQHNEY